MLISAGKPSGGHASLVLFYLNMKLRTIYRHGYLHFIEIAGASETCHSNGKIRMSTQMYASIKSVEFSIV